MSANEAHAAHATRLTWNEICQRFPDQWVVLADADWVSETEFAFGRAEVIGHHRHRKDASPDVKAARAEDREVGCFWTGPLRGPSPRLIP